MASLLELPGLNLADWEVAFRTPAQSSAETHSKNLPSDPGVAVRCRKAVKKLLTLPSRSLFRLYTQGSSVFICFFSNIFLYLTVKYLYGPIKSRKLAISLKFIGDQEELCCMNLTPSRDPW